MAHHMRAKKEHSPRRTAPGLGAASEVRVDGTFNDVHVRLKLEHVNKPG